jgi:hypothetical protein
VGIFDTKAGETAKFLDNPQFVKELTSKIWGEDGSELPDAQAKAKEANEILEAVVEFATTGVVRSFEECVVWARLKFEEYFVNKIKQLVFSCPEDMKNATGAPFWSPPKRFPSVVTFDPEDAMHMNFIIGAANLKAQIYNVPGYKPQRNPADFKPILAKVMVPEFVPKSGVKIETGEKKEGDAPEVRPAEELSTVETTKSLLGALSDFVFVFLVSF